MYVILCLVSFLLLVSLILLLLSLALLPVILSS